MCILPPPLTTPNRLRTQLQERLPAFKSIDWVPRTGSTNGELITRARRSDQPLVRPWLLGAHYQTEGRGRAGRVWHNRDGAHLMFSCAFDVFLAPQHLATLSPLAGVAACEGLRQLLPVRHQVALRLKWPNDVLWYGAKLAGILTEVTRASTAPASRDHHVVVIGIGINLADSQRLSHELERPIADWAQVCQDCPDLPTHRHADIIAAVAQSWYDSLNRATAFGFEDLVPRYQNVDALQGQSVVVMDQQQELLSGLVHGIAPDGRLLVRNALGDHPISVGDVSIRTPSPR